MYKDIGQPPERFLDCRPAQHHMIKNFSHFLHIWPKTSKLRSGYHVPVDILASSRPTMQTQWTSRRFSYYFLFSPFYTLVSHKWYNLIDGEEKNKETIYGNAAFFWRDIVLVI